MNKFCIIIRFVFPFLRTLPTCLVALCRSTVNLSVLPTHTLLNRNIKNCMICSIFVPSWIKHLVVRPESKFSWGVFVIPRLLGYMSMSSWCSMAQCILQLHMYPVGSGYLESFLCPLISLERSFVLSLEKKEQKIEIWKKEGVPKGLFTAVQDWNHSVDYYGKSRGRTQLRCLH